MTPEPLADEEIEWSDGADPRILPTAVRQAFAELSDRLEIRPLSGGLLHQSFHVRTEDREFVLQRVSDVFASEIHDNIRAVSEHLLARGFATASLLGTVKDEHSAMLGSLGRWRLMPHLGGASFRRVQSVAQARSAGHLVGRFHAAMLDFDRPLAAMGIPYRDTPHYLAAMRAAIDLHRDHRLAAEIAPLGQRVLDAFDALGPPPDVPSRVIHGDLKLDNLLFEGPEMPGRDRAFALIDLDTLMRAPLWVELGDAWRSWCNSSGEDTSSARFAMPIFEASARGFFDGYEESLSDVERRSLVTAPERVTLELCARYVTDTLEESYFGWDDSAFVTSGDHNRVRAFGQWQFFEAACECRQERTLLLDR
jgi:Ser/Thr protein kinase RdoA (MazF antagonist)